MGAALMSLKTWHAWEVGVLAWLGPDSIGDFNLGCAVSRDFSLADCAPHCMGCDADAQGQHHHCVCGLLFCDLPPVNHVAC